MNRFKGGLVSLGANVRRYGVAALVPASLFAPLAHAQFATGVTAAIDDSKADMILIGVAVLAVVVLVAAIGWASRATRK